MVSRLLGFHFRDHLGVVGLDLRRRHGLHLLSHAAEDLLPERTSVRQTAGYQTLELRLQFVPQAHNMISI